MFAANVHLKNTTTGGGTYIFVTIYQKSILSPGVYNYYFLKRRWCHVIFIFHLFVLFQHCSQGAGGPKRLRSSQDVCTWKHCEQFPQRSQVFVPLPTVGGTKEPSNWFFVSFFLILHTVKFLGSGWHVACDLKGSYKTKTFPCTSVLSHCSWYNVLFSLSKWGVCWKIQVKFFCWKKTLCCCVFSLGFNGFCCWCFFF